MSLWTDFRDAVTSPFKAVGNVIEDTVKSVLHNPIGAITSAVAMSYGIPPAWAGALGGAAGAAASGGNVVKAAITGGAMGYMGQAAGAAAGSAGPIAAAAASGAAAGVTGAVLTGQDVVTAMKQGLILGTVAGGVHQFMTPQEAIASVPKDKLAEIYASGKDPLGELIQQQGWTDSDSARAAASKAFSQNMATTMTQLREAIPDYVLKDAQAAVKANPATDVGKYVADKMGWQYNGVTGSAISQEYGNFVTAGKPAQAPVSDAVSKPVSPVSSLEDSFSNYAKTDTFDPSKATQADIGTQASAYAKQHLLQDYPSTNSSLINNLENPNSFYSKNLMAAEATSDPSGYLHRAGYNDATVKQLMDYYDAKQYAQQQYAQEQQQYAQAQQATNTVTDAGGGTSTTEPFRVESGGVPKFAGMQGAGTPPPGYDVATPEQIWGPNDTGTASKPYTPGSYYDAESNTWYTPKSVAPTPPTTPNVPIIVPPINVTPSVTPQPSTPVAPAPSTQTSGTGTSGGSIAGPTTPVSPTTQMPYSTTTTQPDGSVVQEEHKSDGTVVTTVISGPTTGGTSSSGSIGTGTGTGTGGTSVGPISSGGTTNTNPPLTPPTQVTIPPGSSTVTPVETTTKTPTDTTTTPTDTTTPIVPIVVPDPNNPGGNYHYGTYNVGPAQHINIPTGLNPGWMAPTPMYNTTSPNQSQYYWGGHPFQTGPQFDPNTYNNVPAAPQQPWGSQTRQVSATPQQILQAMGMYYPLIGSTNTPVPVTGAVRP